MDFLQNLSLDHDPKANPTNDGTQVVTVESGNDSGHPPSPKTRHEHLVDKLLHHDIDNSTAGATKLPSSSESSSFPSSESEHDKHTTVLEKLSSAFSAQDEETKSVPPPEHEQVKHEHLFDKLSSTFSGNQVNPPPAATPASVPAHHETDTEKTEGLANKLVHAFSGTHEPTPTPPPPLKPEPESLLGKIQDAVGFEHAHTSPPPPPPPSKPKSEGLLGKIEDALGFEPTPPPSPQPPAPPAKHEGLAHKISGVFDFDGSKKKREEEEARRLQEERRKAEEEEKKKRKHQHHHVHVDDVIGKLGLGHHEEVEVKAEVVPPKESEGSLLDKIGFRHHEEVAVQPSKVQEQGFTSKIEKVVHLHSSHQNEPSEPPSKEPETVVEKFQEAIHLHHHQPEPPKEQNLVDKIESAVHDLHRKEEPPQPETLAEKIGGALGLGVTEKKKKQDGLDKTIDFVQEHILHEGPQKNESYIEQLKDEEIAKAIRAEYKYATGHEFPIKEKEKDEHRHH